MSAVPGLCFGVDKKYAHIVVLRLGICRARDVSLWQTGFMEKKGKGRAMAKYTKQDIIAMVEEEDVEFIRMQFTDIEGNFKNVAITASQLEKALANDCMFDCSLVRGMLPTDNADMFLYPDLDTFAIFPWRPQQGRSHALSAMCTARTARPLRATAATS